MAMAGMEKESAEPDISFSEHFDALISKLRAELLHHYDRDVASRPEPGSENQVDSEVIQIVHSTPILLSASKGRGDSSDSSSAEAMGNQVSAARESPESMPRPLVVPLHDSSDESDAEVSESSLGDGELKTPKKKATHPEKPPPPRPELPELPKEDAVIAPKATPKMLLVSQVAPSSMEHLPLPNTLETQDTARTETLRVQAIAMQGHRPSVNSAMNSSRRADSESSFESSSDGDDHEGLYPDGHIPSNSRLAKKRISNASMADFFKREPAVSRVWLFLEDPDSSRSAYWFATLSNYFVCLSIFFTIWQASLYPPFSGMAEGIIQIIVEVLMLLEFIIRWIASGPKREFVRNPYNVIDLAAFIPTIVRLASGVETPSTARNPFSHYVLVCFVPVIRQLKLIRRFQKLQLLLHVLTTVFDALKLLLFMVCLIVLFFAAVLYIVEPNDANAVDSLPTSIWLCIVTVTTVGYGDVAPTTWPGRIVAGTLCFISVLFMAMPLSVLGNAMSQTWADRHRILLMTRTRSRLKNLGYSADDMPKLFKKFDTDNNGELELEEFVDLVAAMKVGVKPHEASELFMAFDSDGNGGIDEREFMKALFPLDYRRMYRRASGMTFGA
ncbi:KCNB2 [Symbiodinium sp. CCMP2592]|nr:KCNB2 [Symbiodinium sp. CCMP2592]